MKPVQQNRFKLSPVLAISLSVVIVAAGYFSYTSYTTQTSQGDGVLASLIGSESFRGRNLSTLGSGNSSSGYLKQPTAFRFGASTAHAAGDGIPSGYDRVLFKEREIENPEDRLSQYIHIDLHNFTQGTTTQVKGLPGDNSEFFPVYSSVSQKLAYATEPGPRGSDPAECSVVIAEPNGNNPLTIPHKAGSYCMLPISWSPSGTILALNLFRTSGENLATYNTETGVLSIIENPADDLYSVVSGGWLGNTTLSAIYTSRDSHDSSKVDGILYSINVTNGTFKRLRQSFVDSYEYEIASGTVYYRSSEKAKDNVALPNYIRSFKLTDPENDTVYLETEGYDSFSVRRNQDGSAHGLVYSAFTQSQPLIGLYENQVGSDVLREIPVGGTASQELLDFPNTAIKQLISWNENGTELLLVQEPAMLEHSNDLTVIDEFVTVNLSTGQRNTVLKEVHKVITKL